MNVIDFAGEKEKSIEWYKKTLTLYGWAQEKYWSCLQIGNLYKSLNEPEKAFYYYTISYHYDDSRQECFYEVIRDFRK